MRSSRCTGCQEIRWRCCISASGCKRPNIPSSSRLSVAGIFQAHRLLKEVRRGLDQISAPALTIHAVEDDVSSIARADFVERHIRSASKRKLILHNSYHIITLDNEKETVAEETRAFFDVHVAASKSKLKFA